MSNMASRFGMAIAVYDDSGYLHRARLTGPAPFYCMFMVAPFSLKQVLTLGPSKLKQLYQFSSPRQFRAIHTFSQLSRKLRGFCRNVLGDWQQSNWQHPQV